MLLLLIAIFLGKFHAEPKASTAAETKSASERAAAREIKQGLRSAAAAKIEVNDYRWGQYSYGLSSAYFTLFNANVFPVKDIVIRCEYVSRSGTLLNRYESTIFVAVPAKGLLEVNDLKMGFVNDQAYSSGCDVVDFDVAATRAPAPMKR
ncbi:MAG: hypothetical protein WD073_09960 [Xanthobacteraceae bacterium]